MKGLPPWLTVLSASQLDTSLPLDAGECEAICLAQEIHAEGLIVDDAEARQIARERGLMVTGTIGVLELGAARAW
jgi:predicted nucleic acid-binding protein